VSSGGDGLDLFLAKERRVPPTSIHKDLIEFVACPATHQSVREADRDVLERVNQKIARGECTNKGGKKVEQPLAEALVTADGKLLYPIRDGILVMMIDESIVL
jgi:uncharacterized protein YbaR (Trm112 family)